MLEILEILGATLLVPDSHRPSFVANLAHVPVSANQSVPHPAFYKIACSWNLDHIMLVNIVEAYFLWHQISTHRGCRADWRSLLSKLPGYKQRYQLCGKTNHKTSSNTCFLLHFYMQHFIIISLLCPKPQNTARLKCTRFLTMHDSV